MMDKTKFVIVPIHPTAEMVEAAYQAVKFQKADRDSLLVVWTAMIKAAPDHGQELGDTGKPLDSTAPEIQCPGCTEKQLFIDRAFKVYPNLDVDVDYVAKGAL